MTRVQPPVVAGLFTLLLAGPAAVAAPAYDPEETAVAAWVDFARHDVQAMCALCLRVEPGVDCASWGPARGLPPFHYEPLLAEAARWHSVHMRTAPCFQHESCCELERAADGTIRCAAPPCSSCDAPTACPGTGTGDRYALLGYVPFAGENIAAGYPTSLAVACGWLDSAGHRENILSAANDLGVGLDREPNRCAGGGGYWTQGFGARGDRPAPGYVPAAGVMPGSPGPPLGAAGRDVTLVAYVHDPDPAAAPVSVRAVVDGRCVALAPALGSGGRALWSAAADVGPGCHAAWFVARDAADGRHVFPPVGSVAFAKDGTCPEDRGRLPAACEGADACTAEGERIPCYSGELATLDVGRCRAGARTCTDGAYGACAGEVGPAPEVCNGLDDDCDGAADEELTDEGGACASGEPGPCGEGVSVCRGGVLVCESIRPPADETCNGLDDDCDGEVDDGFGLLACGDGACRRLVPACDRGDEGVCVPGFRQAAELCGNGLDDDCDGSPDQGCACAGEERSCWVGPTAALGRGVCRAGVQRCVAGVWGPCEGAVLPSPERCNGLDDDCDRAVDEGLGRDGCGLAGCRVSVARCVGGQARACEPLVAGAELCNGRDDSCDGAIDEGCVCPPGARDPCFGAGGALAGVGRCRAGERTCADGTVWGACTGEVGPERESCGNGEDDDCDGLVDEEDCVTPPELEQGDAGPGTPPPEGCGCRAAATLPAWLGLAFPRRRRRS